MSEGTEAPTEHRLREARRKGDRPHSREASTAFGMSIWTVVIVLGGPLAYVALGTFVEGILRRAFDANAPRLPTHWMTTHLFAGLAMAGLVGLLAFALPEFLQSRGELASKRKLFDLARISPVAGLKKLFTLARLIELAMASLRLAVTVVIAWKTIGPGFALPLLAHGRPWQATWAAMLPGAVKVLAASSAIFLALAAIDLLVQHRLWIRRNRMKKDEIMREHKEQEGDPLVRGLRQAARIEAANQ